MLTFSEIKDIFFTIGSLAGVTSFILPILKDKLDKDISRVNYIKSIINEQELVDLELYIYESRRVPDIIFSKLDRIRHEYKTNQDTVRFSGPTAKYLRNEIVAVINSYDRLREYIQVPGWEPSKDSKNYSWMFNKKYFLESDHDSDKYVKHLKEAAKIAVEILRSFQHFQIVSEFHLYEIPFIKLLLKRRFAKLESR
jgi:hypothetical protein